MNDREIYQTSILMCAERGSCNPQCPLRFVKGRLKFGDSENSEPFPSMVANYR